MDQININGLQFFAHHGVYPPEKELGQSFILDLTLYTDLTKAAASDHVEDTVNYAQVIEVARQAFCAERYNLIERAAGAVLKAVQSAFPAIKQLEVTVSKPHAAIDAVFDTVSVKLCGGNQSEDTN